MDFTTYLQTVRLRAAPLDPISQLFHAKLGMVTEAGELCDLFKRLIAYGKEFDHVNLLDECGDWMWYFVLYCDESRISMRSLDDLAANGVKEFNLEREKANAPAKVALTIAATTGFIADAETLGLGPTERKEMIEAGFNLILWQLFRHGFTVKQCLIANDAKLEKRTGKAFDAGAILNRDTDAERAVLEGHAKNQ